MKCKIQTGLVAIGTRPEVMNVLTTECKNIIITHKGHLVPRTQENLKKLHAYTRRKYGRKNIFDRRTKAYRYLKLHDSEVK